MPTVENESAQMAGSSYVAIATCRPMQRSDLMMLRDVTHTESIAAPGSTSILQRKRRPMDVRAFFKPHPEKAGEL